MPTTPLGLPYPAPTDPVSGAPADIQSLAEAADAKQTALILALAAAQHLPCGMASSGPQQVLSQSTPGALLLTDELVDTAGMVDLALQPNGITIQQDGVYLTSAFTQWQSNSTGNRTTAILRNGAITDQVIMPAPTAAPYGMSTYATSLVACIAGDVIAVGGNHTVGTTNVTFQTCAFAHLLVIRISS